MDMAKGCLQRNLSKKLAFVSDDAQHSRKFIILLGSMVMAALMLSSIAAHAEETMQTSCKSGNLVRRIVVVESSLSSGLSCEVIYWKDTEAPGVRQILWTAKQDAGYCYSKSLGLASRLAEMGWSCESISSPVN